MLRTVETACGLVRPDESILAIVMEFTEEMMKLQMQGATSELPNVQPAVSRLLATLVNHLSNSDRVLVESSRDYCLKFSVDTVDVKVDGETDHSIKLLGADARFCVVKDKKLSEKLSSKNINQITSQVMNELQNMELLDFIPACYCGILHNGKDWIFVWRVMGFGKMRWYHVKCPPTFTDMNLNRENCRTVAILLDYTLMVMDQNITDFLNPSKRLMLSTTFEGSVIEEEDGSGDDGNSDDDADSNEQRDDTHDLVSGVQGLTISKSKSSNIPQSQRGTKQASSGKENCLPLTMEFLSRQITQKYINF